MNNPPKILVVDDTPTNISLLEYLLQASGYQVVTAVSGAEALGKVEAESPDLVLLDEMSGQQRGSFIARANG